MAVHPICQAVDQLQELYQKWVDDPDPRFAKTFPQELMEKFETTVEFIAEQDCPAQCRGVASAAEKFDGELQLFIDGNCSPDGEPRNSFDRALRDLFYSREQSDRLVPKMPESVAELRRQGVSDHQIAHAIYGYQGEGPFLRNGVILKELIDREAAQQWSVVGRDWIPGYEAVRIAQEHKTQRYQNQPAAPQHVEKPETVEGLLRDGQFVDVIARLCKVEQSQVLAVAEALKIEPNFRPNLGAERAPQEPQITKEQAASVESGALPTHPAKRTLPRSAKDKIVALEAEGKSIADIAAEVGPEVEGGLTPKAIAAILRKAKASAEPAQ